MTGVPPSHPHSHPDAEEASDWEDELRHHLRPGFVVLGIGSRLRGDDAVGAVVAERLAQAGLERALDCGGVPENFLGRIERLEPRDILFVDAVDFGGEPGQIAFFGGEKFAPQSVSTHSAGLSPLMDFLSAGGEVTCWVLAVQPADTTYGAEMSEPVQRAAERILASDFWRRDTAD
ncbi:MAG: hydrogenase 3 maturation endopeptidase HyCI [Candidatus Brocadiia bacterium]